MHVEESNLQFNTEATVAWSMVEVGILCPANTLKITIGRNLYARHHTITGIADEGGNTIAMMNVLPCKKGYLTMDMNLVAKAMD